MSDEWRKEQHWDRISGPIQASKMALERRTGRGKRGRGRGRERSRGKANHLTTYLAWLLLSATTATFIQRAVLGANCALSGQIQGQPSKQNFHHHHHHHYHDHHLQQHHQVQLFSNLLTSGQVENLTSSLVGVASLSAGQARQVLGQPEPISVLNVTSQPPEDSMKFPLYMRILATFACLLIFTVGVCGNLLVPIVVIKTKYLRNSTNLFLINLALADLLVLIICEPTVLIELHSRPETWLLGEPMCKISNFVEMSAANASIFTILAISFERYYAICKPLKAGYKCTRLRATIIICFIWLLSFILTSPILIMAKSSETIYIDGSLVYNCILETDTYWHKMYVFVSMFAFFCLPLIVLMLVYWLISRRLIRENLALSTPTSLATNESQQHAHQNCGAGQLRANDLENYHEGAKRRSQSLRKAASLKDSVSNFLSLRYSNHRRSQTGTQTDVVVVGIQPQQCPATHLKRPPRMSSNKALSLDHHSTAKVGCYQQASENNNNYHHHQHSKQVACNSSFVRSSDGKSFTVNEVCKPDLSKPTTSNGCQTKEALKQNQRQQQSQQALLKLLARPLRLISLDSLNQLMYRFLGFARGGGVTGSGEGRQSSDDQAFGGAGCRLAYPASLFGQGCCCNETSDKICFNTNSKNNISTKSASNGAGVGRKSPAQLCKTTETNGLLMQSICELHANGCGEVLAAKKNHLDCGEHHSGTIPFLSSIDLDSSTSTSAPANGNSTDVYERSKSNQQKQQQQPVNQKMRFFKCTARTLLDSSTIRFKWPRRLSISSSISTSTQTNSTNLPSELSTGGPSSQCESFNNTSLEMNASQQASPGSALHYNCSSSSGSNNSSANQIRPNSSTPDEMIIEADSGYENEALNQHGRRQKVAYQLDSKCAHFESSFGSMPTACTLSPPLCRVGAAANAPNASHLQQATSSSPSNSSLSPYSSKSASPDSQSEQQQSQQQPARLELRQQLATNDSSCPYKDLLVDSMELLDNESSSTLKGRQSAKSVTKSHENADGGRIALRISDNHLEDNLAAFECDPLMMRESSNRNDTNPNCDNQSKQVAVIHTSERFQNRTIDSEQISSVKNEPIYKNTNSPFPCPVRDKLKGSERLKLLLAGRKSLDLNPTSPANNELGIRCCEAHNSNHFQFNFKRLSRGNRRSNPVICSNFHGKTHLSELLVVQDLSKKQQMDSRRQVVIMLAFVVAAFFLLFFPYRVFTIWLILSTEDQVQSLGMETYYNLTYFSRILIYLHSAINPIAYNLISTKFRRAFMSILLCHGSSTRRHFTTDHRIVTQRVNNVDNDQRKSIPSRQSQQIRLLR